jgi:hypothetical protein
LKNRVYLVVGIALVGYEPYITELLQRMGIELTVGMKKHLSDLWAHKKRVSALHKNTKFKKKRHEKKRVKMENEIKQAENKRRKQGFYKLGKGFNLCLPIVNPKANICHAGCGGTDHKTSQSKKCPMNLANKHAKAKRSKEDDDREIKELRARLKHLEDKRTINK